MKRLRIIGPVVLVVLGGGTLAVRALFAPQHFDVVSIATLPGYQDPALLERAWKLPVAATFQRPLLSQSNPTVCGPASLADVQRSRGAPITIDQAADAAGCTWGVCPAGRTLEQLAHGAEVLGARATVLRDLTLDQFREELRHSNDPSRRYLVNFNRGLLFADGGGHHSPIGGYLEDLDLVFVLDVNAHFGPWLVPASRLYTAMDSIDPSTGKKRGLLCLQ